MPSPTPWLFAAFLILPLMMTGLALKSARQPLAWLLALLWLAFTGGLAAGGYLLHFAAFPPPMLGLVVSGMVITTVVSSSGKLQPWLARLSLPALVAFQAFRLPLELVMHQAYQQGLMPVQMSFSGRNFDIIIGMLALPLAGRLRQVSPSRSPIWAWNLLGLVSLMNIGGIAITSFPGPLRLFHNEPSNLWVATFPFCWLPTVLVPLALGGHILITRKLMAQH